MLRLGPNIFSPLWFDTFLGEVDDRVVAPEIRAQHAEQPTRSRRHECAAASRRPVRAAWLRRSDRWFDWHVYSPDELAAEAAAVGLRLLNACAEFNEGRAPSPLHPRMQLVFERVQRHQ